MKKDVVAIILGGGAGSRLFPLTSTRSKPAVPIAGKYRLVDIPISNCLNSEIGRIYVLTQFNSASLNRHLDRIDELIGALQPAVRDELGLLLSLLTNGAGRIGLFGHREALEARSVDALRHSLQGMRLSGVSLRQQAYFGLRELHCGTHYAQPEAWARMGYPGPTTI